MPLIAQSRGGDLERVRRSSRVGGERRPCAPPSFRCAEPSDADSGDGPSLPSPSHESRQCLLLSVSMGAGIARTDLLFFAGSFTHFLASPMAFLAPNRALGVM